MSISSKRDKNGRFESDKESAASSNDDSKTAFAPSDSVSDDDSTQSQQDASTAEAKSSARVAKSEPSKMDNARTVFKEMFGKDGIARKDIILAFLLTIYIQE